MKVISPSETTTSLQIVYFFNFQKNQHYEGGTYAVNEHFGGEIHRICESGIFRGEALEGDPEELNLDFVELVGYTAAMEAVKLRVKDFCFAPSLKDAGIAMSFEKTDISKMLGRGMHRAITTSVTLSQKKTAKTNGIN